MKCYTVQGDEVEAGFEVWFDEARPYVRITSHSVWLEEEEDKGFAKFKKVRAPLADSLVEQLKHIDHAAGGAFEHKTRLMRCDFEVRGGQVWLIPEQQPNEQDALVLVSQMAVGWGKSAEPLVEFKTGKTESAVLSENEVLVKFSDLLNSNSQIKLYKLVAGDVVAGFSSERKPRTWLGRKLHKLPYSEKMKGSLFVQNTDGKITSTEIK